MSESDQITNAANAVLQAQIAVSEANNHLSEWTKKYPEYVGDEVGYLARRGALKEREEALKEREEALAKLQTPAVQQNLLTIDLLQQQTRLLNLVVEEVNRTRKKRLNPWAKDSLHSIGSERDPKFRNNVIKYYRRESRSGTEVKCQILEEYITKEDAQSSIIAAHIWKAGTKGRDLDDFGLKTTDVNNPRNGMFLTKGIEVAFDKQQVCFLYNFLEKKLYLWVADESIKTEVIEGSKPEKYFSDVHLKPLCCGGEDMPFRRLLSHHARLTLELRIESLDIPTTLNSDYDASPGRANTILKPISQAIDDMVQAGEDASYSETEL